MNNELADKLEKLLEKATPDALTVETVATSAGSCHKIGPLPVVGHRHQENYACIYADSMRVGIDDNLTGSRRLRAFADLFAELVNNAPAIIEALRKP